jgi:hypothetical protein
VVLPLVDTKFISMLGITKQDAPTVPECPAALGLLELSTLTPGYGNYLKTR